MLEVLQENSPGAGLDVEASICSAGVPFTPYAYINGGATTGQFLYEGLPFPLPDFNVAGTYALDYVVQGSFGCANDSANFTFTVVAAPNAGTGGSFTVCINDLPFPMSTLLTNADGGGTWTDPSGLPFGEELDPATDISGIYSYTVEGEAPCTDAVTYIALVIDPCAGMVDGTDPVPGIRWLGQSGLEHSFHMPGESNVKDLLIIDAAGRSNTLQGVVQHERVSVALGAFASGSYTLFIRTGSRPFACRFMHLGE
jgi:hypothetical protein